MSDVVRSEQAAADLDQIVHFIACDDPDAAHRWLDQIEELFRLLATQPELGEELQTSRFGRIRRRAFGAYLIDYRALPEGVEVLRVVHGARDQSRII